jgi:hypothetical protein
MAEIGARVGNALLRAGVIEAVIKSAAGAAAIRIHRGTVGSESKGVAAVGLASDHRFIAT